LRTILIIGIGAGNPEHITVQAINALNRADVLFIPNKGAEKADLRRLRHDICERYIKGRPYRSVEFETLRRGTVDGDYGATVREWHDRTADQYAGLFETELRDGEVGAFLVWGDPGLYDSTLRIVDAIRARGDVALDCEVIPGITSVQALTARHRITLNAIGEPVHISTGRRLAEGLPTEFGTTVVMLDGEQAYRNLDGELEIYWGAYVGTEDEVLVSGRLSEVAEEIDRVRREARERKGWIMDTYLLRRPGND
jgi:precorrin-6A synthase